MNNLVSIIIPCFNQGHFIMEALDSIDENAISYPVEIIIVNDGSTDPATNELLETLSLNSKYIVIKQHNMGLANARNTGIAVAKGNYILPLDADNKITPAYINKGLPFLISGTSDIVYGKPYFFGDVSKGRKFKSKPFNIYHLLEQNFIDACAIYRKEVWIKNNGYDNNKFIKVFEDWEFWINAWSNDFKFHFIDEQLFYYRMTGSSMMSVFPEQKLKEVHTYLLEKHSAIFLYHFVKLSYIKRKYDIDIKRFVISPFIFLFYIFNIIKKPVKKANEKLARYKPVSLKRN
ncbi:glycosyltransferase family A protein [soil metagenome]